MGGHQASPLTYTVDLTLPCQPFVGRADRYLDSLGELLV